MPHTSGSWPMTPPWGLVWLAEHMFWFDWQSTGSIAWTTCPPRGLIAFGGSVHHPVTGKMRRFAPRVIGTSGTLRAGGMRGIMMVLSREGERDWDAECWYGDEPRDDDGLRRVRATPVCLVLFVRSIDPLPATFVELRWTNRGVYSSGNNPWKSNTMGIVAQVLNLNLDYIVVYCCIALRRDEIFRCVVYFLMQSALLRSSLCKTWRCTLWWKKICVGLANLQSGHTAPCTSHSIYFLAYVLYITLETNVVYGW
jgi:hypothetical protein